MHRTYPLLAGSWRSFLLNLLHLEEGCIFCGIVLANLVHFLVEQKRVDVAGQRKILPRKISHTYSPLSALSETA